ncbi:MAG TPA: DUF1987 domain-containing protein [Flavobacteriales bacterium]|nr:DUF1987 domain-containing protein [Flavobacteriales bacterium]
MQNYLLESSPKSPLIDARPTGEILIDGICIPEDVQKLFEPFITWLNEYCKSPANKTVLTVKLAYFNTSTAAVLLAVFRILAKLKLMGNEAVINWYFEEGDLEIEDSGHDYAGLIDTEFNVLSYVK